MHWFWLLWAYASLFALGLADNARGPLFPQMISVLGLSDTQASAFFLLSSVSGLVSTFSSGWWLKHWGAKTSAVVFSLVFAFGLIGVGMVQSYMQVIGAIAVMGFGMSGCGVLQNVLAVEAVPAKHRRAALGLLHCMYGASSWLSPLALLAMRGPSWLARWNAPFVVLAMGPLALALVALFASPMRVRAPSPIRTSSEPMLLQGQRRLLVFGLISSLYVLSEIMLSSRLVLYLRRGLSWPELNASQALAAFFALMMLGRLGLVLLPTRWSARSFLLVAGGFSFVGFSLGLGFSPWFLPMTGLSMSVFFPVLMAWVNEEFPSQRERVTGYLIGANALGLIFMHLVVGAISDRVGLWWALWLGPSALFAVCVLLVFQHRARFT